MKNKITFKTLIVAIMITAILSVTISVTAVKLSASDIGFKSNHEGWEATNVNDAMNDLYDISKYEITPDTYFYDSSTSGEQIVRYKKVEDKYYLCDKNGNITNEEEQDITNVTLVEYVGTTAGNINTGTAGFSNSEFILGEGKTAPDSMTISESGYTQKSDTEYRTFNRSIGVKNFSKMTITISDIGMAAITISADGTTLYNRGWSGGGVSATYDISNYNTVSIYHFSLASSSFPSISIKLS